MAIKAFSPDIKMLGQLVTPDEVDRYEVVNYVMPGTASTWWASAGTAGTASSIAAVIINALPDYPRNIRFVLAGTGVGMAGTFVANGKDQFGVTITENLGFGSADNGGTVVGTKVFAQFTSGTLNYGTAVGNGTPAIGFVTGTNCLFGLPVKLNGTTDVVHIGMVNGTGAITVNGGTVAGFVDSPMSAFRAPATLTGTQSINVWVRPTFAGENYTAGTMRNLTQVT